MGVTIHWECDQKITKKTITAIVEIVKEMSTDIGFDFVESEEDGYMLSIETRMLDGTIHTHETFVPRNATYGYFPQMRMQAIKNGKKLIPRWTIMAHPTNTESFALEFYKKNGHWKLMYGFCKTQPFSEEDPAVNARSHLWVIATLMEIKKILPKLEISDEADFYEEGLALQEMDIGKILESFGENLQMITRLAEELKEMGYQTEVGTEIKTERKPDESVKSTGHLESETDYMYTVYENREKIYQQLLETQRKLVIKIDIPKEDEA